MQHRKDACQENPCDGKVFACHMGKAAMHPISFHRSCAHMLLLHWAPDETKVQDAQAVVVAAETPGAYYGADFQVARRSYYQDDCHSSCRQDP